jgi:hypothetical protein
MLSRSIALISVGFAALAWNSEPLDLVALASSVQGSGTINFGASVEHVSVNTSGSSGRATFNDRTVSGNVNGTIDVNCVRIVENEATISGIVTHSNRKSIEGFEGLFQIRDNGKGRGGKSSGPDMMSPVLFHAVGTGPNCQVPSEFDLAPVKGDFTVRP